MSQGRMPSVARSTMRWRTSSGRGLEGGLGHDVERIGPNIQNGPKVGKKGNGAKLAKICTNLDENVKSSMRIQRGGKWERWSRIAKLDHIWAIISFIEGYGPKWAKMGQTCH